MQRNTGLKHYDIGNQKNSEPHQTINQKSTVNVGKSHIRQRHTGKASRRQPERSRSIHQTIPKLGLPSSWRMRTRKCARLPPNMDSERSEQVARLWSRPVMRSVADDLLLFKTLAELERKP